MIDQQTVYDTCNTLAHEGPVSFRKLYAAVGGNRENVRQWWHQWQSAYGEEDPLLPEAFTTSLQKFLETDTWEARYQALTRDLIPGQEARLATLDAQGHAAEEQLHLVQARLKAAVEELQVIRAEVVANRQALLTFVSGGEDGTDG